MDYDKTAQGVLDAVGGSSNISHLEHCSTRLRFTLADTAKADITKLKAVPGVMGVVGEQPQVVIGNEVVEVHDAISKLIGHQGGAHAAAAPVGKQSWGAWLLDFIVGVFQPLIPAIAGAGVLKSLMLLLAMFGWVSTKDPTYTTLVAISDATFYFLPLMVAVTTATKLNANRLVALAAVSVMVLPTMTKAMTDGTSVFGIHIPNITYSSQVFPAILCVALLALMERLWTRITPKPIRVFFVPMMALVITVPITLLFLGPLGYWMGTYFTAGVLWVYGTLGWVAFPLLAVALPFIISVGMHKAFIPYVVNQVGTTGSEPLYLPVSLAHNIAESGASFGVALRTKDSGLRATAISAGVSALFGITEPALYGVTLQNKRALWSVLIGAATGATWMGLMAVKGFVVVGPGLASISLFIDPTNPQNLVNAIIGAVISFAAAIVASLMLWSDAASTTLQAAGVVPRPNEAAPGEGADVLAPVDGDVVALADVPDKVFAGGVLGEGCAIKPTSNEFRSPANGTVEMLFDTHHAIAIRTDEGSELLIHIGLDTVRLGGQHFSAHVAKGDRVEAGQLLLTADLDAIGKAGYDTTTPVVVTNSADVEVSAVAIGAHAAQGDPLFHATLKVPADVVS